MNYRVRVEVGLKPGHSDPEGETTKDSLVDLNYSVKKVSVSKIYDIVLVASSLEMARKNVEEMCKRLLANPVKDNFVIKIDEAE